MLVGVNPYGAPPPGNPPPGYGPPQGGYGPGPGGPGGFGPGPQGNFGPPQGPPPKKKGMSGCLLAFLIVLGLFVLGGGITAFLIYREFGSFFGAAHDAMLEVQKAQKAPGTKELRSLGCEEAMVVDGKKLLAIGQRVEDEVAKRQNRTAKKLEDKSIGVVVYCKNTIGETPTCDKVASSYVGAVSPTESFVVSVMHLGDTECSATYSSDGKKTGTAEVPTLPTTL